MHDPTNQVLLQVLRDLVFIIDRLEPCNLKYQLIVWYNLLHSMNCFDSGLIEPRLHLTENLAIGTHIASIDIDYKVLTLLSVDKLIRDYLRSIKKQRGFPLDCQIIQLLCLKIEWTMETDPEIEESIKRDIVTSFLFSFCVANAFFSLPECQLPSSSRFS